MAQDELLSIFYNVLFHPVTEFRVISEGPVPKNRLLLYGLGFVMFVSAMAPFFAFNGGHLESLNDLLVQVPLHAITGVVLWLLMGCLVGLGAYVFLGETRLKTFLTLSAFSTVPWLLLAPSILLKQGLGFPGVFMSVLWGLSVWGWTVVLFGLALAMTYRLSVDKVIILLFIPFALSVVSLFWLVGFVINLQQIVL